MNNISKLKKHIGHQERDTITGFEIHVLDPDGNIIKTLHIPSPHVKKQQQ